MARQVCHYRLSEVNLPKDRRALIGSRAFLTPQERDREARKLVSQEYFVITRKVNKTCFKVFWY